jgi:hypothetical protein
MATTDQNRRCYTVEEILEKLQLPRRTFERYRSRLDFLQELQPRIGRTRRYRAEPIDQYLAGQWPRLTQLKVHRLK